MAIVYTQTRLIVHSFMHTKASPSAVDTYEVHARGHEFGGSTYAGVGLLFDYYGLASSFSNLDLGTGTGTSGTAYEMIIEDDTDTTSGIVEVGGFVPSLISQEDDGSDRRLQFNATSSSDEHTIMLTIYVPPAAPVPDYFSIGATYRVVIMEP